ncbi:MAG: maleylpyruvate isomerase family mycothiol-dependent enzyme [Nocardioides sp.]
MNSVMRLVSAELEELVSVLRVIPESDWDRPSACDGFRVRDVAAHLSLVRAPMTWRLAKALAHTPEQIALIGGAWSIEYADEHTPAELIGFLEQRVANPRKGFLGRIDPADNMLADHATHVQDVRIGLDRRAPHDADRGRAVLDAAVRVWRPVTWGSKERAKNLRLVASDIGWAHGSGPEVSGPYDALLLALSGRSAGLPYLSGEGLTTLEGRIPAAV